MSLLCSGSVKDCPNFIKITVRPLFVYRRHGAAAWASYNLFAKVGRRSPLFQAVGRLISSWPRLSALAVIVCGILITPCNTRAVPSGVISEALPKGEKIANILKIW